MLRLSLLFVVVMVIAGCGKSSDPVQNPQWRALRDNTVPQFITNRQKLDQTVAPNNYLAVTILNQDKDSGNFIEEKAGEVQFQITPYPGIASYVVSSIDKPSGSSIRPSTTPNVFLFDWTPPKGTVSEDQSVKLLSVHLMIAPNTNDPRYMNMVSEKNIPISIVKVRTSPTVVKIEDPKNGKVDEGADFIFYVYVLDPSETESPPDIALSPFDPENKEDPKAFAFIQPVAQDAVKVAGVPGEWKKAFRFSMAGISIDESQLVKIKDLDTGRFKVLNSIRACANFRAISVSKLASADAIPKCWDVSLSAQSPEFVFLGAPIDKSPLKLTAAPDLKLEFSASIPNKRGSAVVKNLSKNYSKWPGHPNDISCVNGDGNDATFQKCTVTWADPCKAAGKYLFEVSGSNPDAYANGKQKAPSTDSRQLVISAPSSGCAQPAVVAAPAAASSAPTTAAKAPSNQRAVRDTAGAVTGANTETVPAVTPAGDKNTVPKFKRVAKPPFNKAQRDRAKKMKEQAEKDKAANSSAPTTPAATGSAGGTP